VGESVLKGGRWGLLHVPRSHLKGLDLLSEVSVEDLHLVLAEDLGDLPFVEDVRRVSSVLLLEPVEVVVNAAEAVDEVCVEGGLAGAVDEQVDQKSSGFDVGNVRELGGQVEEGL